MLVNVSVRACGFFWSGTRKRRRPTATRPSGSDGTERVANERVAVLGLTRSNYEKAIAGLREVLEELESKARTAPEPPTTLQEFEDEPARRKLRKPPRRNPKKPAKRS